MVNGSKIRELRQAANETSQELANAVGVGQSMITLIETGRRQPSLEILVLIAERFGVTVDALLRKPDEEKPAS